MEMVHVLDHPLLQHKLSILRDETTGVKDFREIVCEIATLMCYDATRNLPLQAVEVQTPVAKAVTYQLAGKKLAIVPVLRAGLGMVEGILTLIPSAKVGHIGLFRDPDTLEPVKYYCKMPTDIADRDVVILDPMLATRLRLRRHLLCQGVRREKHQADEHPGRPRGHRPEYGRLMWRSTGGGRPAQRPRLHRPRQGTPGTVFRNQVRKRFPPAPAGAGPPGAETFSKNLKKSKNT